MDLVVELLLTVVADTCQLFIGVGIRTRKLHPVLLPVAKGSGRFLDAAAISPDSHESKT